jgi:hypothetical protein
MQGTSSIISNTLIAVAVGAITIVALLYKYIFRPPSAAKSSLAPSAQPVTASGSQDDPAEAVANTVAPPSHKGGLEYDIIYGLPEEDLLVFCPGSSVYNPARKFFLPGIFGPSSIDRLMRIDLRFRHFSFLVLQSGLMDKEAWMHTFATPNHHARWNTLHTCCSGWYQLYEDFKKYPQVKTPSGAAISRRFDMYWLDKASPYHCTGGCKCNEIGHFCADQVGHDDPHMMMMTSFTSGRI